MSLNLPNLGKRYERLKEKYSERQDWPPIVTSLFEQLTSKFNNYMRIFNALGGPGFVINPYRYTKKDATDHLKAFDELEAQFWVEVEKVSNAGQSQKFAREDRWIARLNVSAAWVAIVISVLGLWQSCSQRETISDLEKRVKTLESPQPTEPPQ